MGKRRFHNQPKDSLLTGFRWLSIKRSVKNGPYIRTKVFIVTQLFYCIHEHTPLSLLGLRNLIVNELNIHKGLITKAESTNKCEIK